MVDGTSLKERLAAILAADVAGYSRLMAHDDRATVVALVAAGGCSAPKSSRIVVA